MKLSIKNIVRFIVIAPISLYLLYCVEHFIFTPIHPKYTDCGKIISKSNDEVAIKHGNRTELYLNIQFNKSGFKSIKVNPTTYFKNKVGETICFDLDIDISLWYFICNMLGLFVICMLALILIVQLAIYLIEE